MSTLLTAAAILPLLVSIASLGIWRNALARPWAFSLLAVVIAYVMMGIALVLALQGIGIAGDPGHTSPAFGPVERRFSLILVVYALLAFAVLFGLTFFFRKG
jgi:hypothetical protein